MKTISINLYDYDELAPEAKKRALDKYKETAEDPFMQSMLNDECNELLKEHGITCTSNHPICLYSLSHCQGDGLMFEGTFNWNNKDITIKHEGRYYHKYSRVIDFPEASEHEYADFEKVYNLVCDKLEDMGYKHIDYIESEEYFREMCEANDYTFEADGTMRNA